MNNKDATRIYPKLSKEELNRQWNEIVEKYKKESDNNTGENYNTGKLTIIERIKLFFNIL